MNSTNSRPSGVYAVTLGCPKNRVDTEFILGDLLSNGFELFDSPDEADVVIVNTCGFLASARQESIDTLVAMASSMKRGARLVAAGCMAEKFEAEIRARVPSVDIVCGVRSLLDIRRMLQGGNRGPCVLPDSSNPRLVTTGAVAYLKVADGCNRRCAYCLIPSIKGRQKSRPVQDLVNEARGLASTGVREIVVVAQDLSRYGRDLDDKTDLVALVRGLSGVDGIDWVRLMYLFPSDIPDELLDAIAESRNCLPYLDIPVQHADDSVLAAMRRNTTRRGLEKLFGRLRDRIPGLVLRTTLMTGFPGETDAAFANLRDFVEQVRFDMVGVFEFSPEPGSAAARLPGQVFPDVASARRVELESVLSGIAATRRLEMIGTVVQAVAESVDEDSGRVIGRSWFQAPEVDGVTVIDGLSGDDDAVCQVMITGCEDSDFLATRYDG
ncbi:MAG TPA: 30S ribosomal protein S12 methylthiotransferase RimO [Myxococcota bacterium]|nr:30S ribosomal protein S12 methylthiotransferase RimO [Myxococcota bacterium]HQP95398.1 30S ribosomal protein S12 methylthiotransferase RimO [Myxococcota bacterium]